MAQWHRESLLMHWKLGHMRHLEGSQWGVSHHPLFLETHIDLTGLPMEKRLALNSQR